MQKITIIAAVAADGGIGRDGKLLFHISDDLRRFKRLTMGKPMVMGRRTFESLPGLLPGRRHIVVTRRSDYARAGIEVAHSLAEALALCGDEPEIMIIGGGQIYAEAMPVATGMELTRVHATAPDADTHFPEISTQRWVKTHEERHDAYSFVSYEAKSRCIMKTSPDTARVQKDKKS